MACEWLDIALENLANYILYTLDNLNIPEKSAFIFNIDNTLFDCAGNPNKQIIALYHAIKNRGLKIMIITSRKGDKKIIEQTKKELVFYGITGYHLLYFCPPSKKDLYRFKMLSRYNIHERGYTVVMSIGDEDWDIGPYAGIGLRIPKCPCFREFQKNSHHLIPTYF